MLRLASWWIVETRLLRRIGQYIKAHKPLLTLCHQELPSTTNMLTLTSDVETRLLVNCKDTPLAPQGTWQPTALRWSFLQQPTTTDNLTENRSFLQLTIFSTRDDRFDNRKSDKQMKVLLDNQQSHGKQQKQRKPLNKCSHNRDIQMSKSDTIWLSNEVCLFTKFWTFLFWKKLMIDSDATDKSEIAQKALVVLVINVKIWGPHISQPREQTPEVV